MINIKDMIINIKDIKSDKKVIFKNALKNNITKNNNFTLDHFTEYFKVTKHKLTNIYLNTRRTNIKTTLNSKCENFTIIIKGINGLSLNKTPLNINCATVTFNSLGTNYTNYNQITDNEFNYISDNFIKYNDKISYKKDGIILIYLNTITGWYSNFIDEHKIENLIKNIRKFVDNKIIIRLHKNDFFKIDLIKYLNNLQKYDVTIDKQNVQWEDLINDVYCVFIQNSFILFELFSYGIPIFNIEEVLSLNSYSDLYLPIEYIKDLEKYKIDRKSLLKKYYSHLFFYKDEKDVVDFITELYKKYYM